MNMMMMASGINKRRSRKDRRWRQLLIVRGEGLSVIPFFIHPVRGNSISPF
jgi:hypothetical protein